MLLTLLVTVVGTTLAVSKSLDDIKHPLLESMRSYDPNATAIAKIEITDAWDNAQKDVRAFSRFNFYLLQYFDVLFMSRNPSSRT